MVLLWICRAINTCVHDIPKALTNAFTYVCREMNELFTKVAIHARNQLNTYRFINVLCIENFPFPLNISPMAAVQHVVFHY